MQTAVVVDSIPWFSKINLMCSHPDIPFEFLISFLCMLSRMWKISDFSAQGQSTLRSPYLIHKIPKIFLNNMVFYFDYLPMNFQKFGSFFFFKLKTIFSMILLMILVCWIFLDVANRFFKLINISRFLAWFKACSYWYCYNTSVQVR